MQWIALRDVCSPGFALLSCDGVNVGVGNWGNGGS